MMDNSLTMLDETGTDKTDQLLGDSCTAETILRLPSFLQFVADWEKALHKTIRLRGHTSQQENIPVHSQIVAAVVILTLFVGAWPMMITKTLDYQDKCLLNRSAKDDDFANTNYVAGMCVAGNNQGRGGGGGGGGGGMGVGMGGGGEAKGGGGRMRRERMGGRGGEGSR
jgi:uncharacterized membrane protein YgcG